MNKDMEGKTVYLFGIGNYKRPEHNIQKAVVKKVARVNSILSFDNYDQKFTYKGNTLYTESNSGWIVFESRESLDEYLETIQISKLIADNFQYQRDWMELPIDKLRKIKELLDL